MNARHWVAAPLTAILVAAIRLPVQADGIMLPDSKEFRAARERSLITEPEQKAAIIFRDGIEDLIISPRYSGPASRFAWIIPVPTRPTVGKVEGALFHELARVVMPPSPKGQSKERTAGVPQTAGVQVLERKQVGAYDVAVLRADDPRSLMQWLETNRFAVTPAAEGPIQAHIKDGWTFVAARVNVPKSERGLQTGTLAPIRLTFRTQQPIYPLRLSAANPHPFKVLVYVIKPAGPLTQHEPVTLHSLKGTGARPLSALWFGVPRTAGAPTLAKLIGAQVTVHMWQRTYRPSECTADIRFSIPGSKRLSSTKRG